MTAVVKVARSRQRDRAVGGLTALAVLAWTSEGLWEVARFSLGLPLGFAVMTFFVYEAMMLTCGLQAERHRKHHPSPGPAGRYVWVLAAITATVVALNAQTLVEALLRFTLPLAAAGLWWVGITAERDYDPDEVKQLREAERARREAIWAISWRRLLVAVGVMRPGTQTLTDAERERRIRQMVTAADQLHTARPDSRRERRALQRLRRLARLKLRARIAVGEEITRRFTDCDRLVDENWRGAFAEAWFWLGETAKADQMYRDWLGDDPQWGFGWIGWASGYMPPPGKDSRTDYQRAEDLLRQGVRRQRVRDRDTIAE